jgi:hypothetical protein
VSVVWSTKIVRFDDHRSFYGVSENSDQFIQLLTVPQKSLLPNRAAARKGLQVFNGQGGYGNAIADKLLQEVQRVMVLAARSQAFESGSEHEQRRGMPDSFVFVLDGCRENWQPPRLKGRVIVDAISIRCL